MVMNLIGMKNMSITKIHMINGVVAQEIEEVLPEVVAEREDGYKAVKYERIIALLIESNKDLLRRVEELEEKVKKIINNLV